MAMPKIPYIGFSNQTLKQSRPVREFEKCSHCGCAHKVEYGEEMLADGSKVPSKFLGFISCGDKSFLVAVQGRYIGDFAFRHIG